jgi:ABC-type dipeptide/oligopeptide/nickel transport system permease component
MVRYTLKRLAAGLLTIFFIATATFVAMHAVPGDPLAGQKALTKEIRENVARKYGLDKPVVVQYGVFLANAVRGDFGISFTQRNRTVNDIIETHFPVSAKLGVLALLIAVVGGILFGSITALTRGKLTDQLVLFVVILLISVPSFVFGGLAQYGLVTLNSRLGFEVLPVGGWGTIRHMLIPATVLGLGTMAFFMRLMRSSLLEVIHQDYIRTARAKGLSRTRIFLGHQLRNSILPMLSYLGPAVAGITTGGFVVETIFSVPGLGRYFVLAVQQLDYTVIMGLTVFYGAFLVLMVILTDIVYGLVDPRISLTGERS